MSSAATRITERLGPDGEICTRSVPVPPEAWRVVIHDHHPGYITWDQFVANRQRLAANRTNGEATCCPVQPGRGFACSRACCVCGSAAGA